MNPRAAVLARRRERLVQRSGNLRRTLTREIRAAQPVLAWADRLQDVWLWLRGNPVMAVAGSMALAASRPRRWLGWGLRAWSAWRLFQRLRAPGDKPSR
ncbi:MAG: YqjK family protein [Hydrogenophaga sp.]|uniref:YqjK family protein n=2 Tax=Hydrogenophaga sp. TaxID=1904254 RepID=UPI0034188D82|nr:YqjK-like family protein [Hydrogenophaga sp.]